MVINVLTAVYALSYFPSRFNATGKANLYGGCNTPGAPPGAPPLIGDRGVKAHVQQSIHMQIYGRPRLKDGYHGGKRIKPSNK